MRYLRTRSLLSPQLSQRLSQRLFPRLPLRLVAGGLLAATLGVAGCSSDNNTSPTTPTGIPNVAGTWTGQYHIRVCTDTINGAAGTVCATVLDPATGTNAASTQPVQVMLTQQGDQVGGTLVFSGWYVQSVPVTGTIGTSGRLWLQGTIAVTDPACPTTTGTFTLSTWFTDLNRERNEMIGSFNFTTRKRLSACLFADLNVQTDTVDITRKASTTTTTTTASTKSTK
jgi:hypothetical protein